MNLQTASYLIPVIFFLALTLYIVYDSNYLKSDSIRSSTEIKGRTTASLPTQQAVQKYDFSHLIQQSEKVWGPIQDDEALLLFSVVKVIRPKILVECGMLTGYSTVNFLKALDSNAKLFTYDIIMHNKNSPAFLDKRFNFILKSQALFSPADINNEKIDFVYLDNGHYFDVNVEFWKKVNEFIKPNGLMAIHDTGLHNEEIHPDEKNMPCVCEFENLCGVEHVPAERQFVNWLIDNYPEWEVINFHSFNFYRHGLTFLQKKYKFSRQPQLRNKCNKNIKIINL